MSAQSDNKSLKAAAVVIPTMAALAVNLWYGPFLIDDMYIGLRYAANLAAGHGLVFNAGERVMGISAPLCVALMGLGGWLGFDLVKVGLALSVVPLTGMVALMQLLALRVLRPGAALACGLAIALFPNMPFTANSGMDTSISMAAVYGTLLALMARRYWLAGFASAVAVLNRPDGAIAAAVAVGYVFWRDRREVYKIIAPNLLLVGPWLGYATWFYGSPIPHSIVAKQANHYTPPWIIAAKILQILAYVAPVTLGAVAGTVQAVRRRSGLAAVPAWMGLYMAGLIWSRIDPFQFMWYLGPLAPGLILLAAYAVEQGGDALAARWRERRPGWVKAARVGPVAVIALAAVIFGLFIRPVETFLKNMGYTRADTYLEIGARLRGRLKPGQTVMVGECGALSYALRDYYILDAMGLNSPVVFKLCRVKDDPSDPRPRFNTMDCDLKIIQDQSPDYIVVYSIFIRIDELSQVPWFRQHYRRLDLGDPALLNYLVFEKISG